MLKYLLVIIIMALPLCCASPSRAIPAFARHYQTDCSSCHTIFPERNQLGEAFARNGFLWPGAPVGQERPRTGYSGETDPSTPSHRMLWPATLPDLAPVSFLAEHDTLYNADGKRRLDADGGTSFAAFTAGSWRGMVGWWANYDPLPDRKLGEAYLQMRLPGPLSLNLKGGRFEPRLSLWKSNDNATASTFGYNEMTVGENSFSIAKEQQGTELNGFLCNRIFVATGVILPEGRGRRGPDWYGHISARLGGTDLQGEDPAVDLDLSRLSDNLSLTVGAFGYVGSTPGSADDFYRTGLEAEVTYLRFTGRVNGIFGRDDASIGGGAQLSRFFMAQGQYLFPRQILAAFRYEDQDAGPEGAIRRYIPSLTYAPWQNLRLALEFQYEAGPVEVNRKGTLRVSFAF